MSQSFIALNISHYNWAKILTFYLCYIILNGLISFESSKRDTGARLLFVGKILSSPEIPIVTSQTKQRHACLPTSIKIIKIAKILQYYSMAMLVLLAGDISPNPGWNYPVLNRPGLKIAQLNIRSLPKHFDELKILLYENPFDVICLKRLDLHSDDIEAVWLEIIFPNKSKTLICSVYRPPNCEFKNFKQNLDRILEDISIQEKEKS